MKIKLSVEKFWCNIKLRRQVIQRGLVSLEGLPTLMILGFMYVSLYYKERERTY